MNSTKMRFLRRIKNKTRLDRMRNEVCRDELKVESTEVTIQLEQLRWLGHVARMGEERLVRRVYEAQKRRKSEEKRRQRKTWMEEVRKARGQKCEDARKMCKDREKWHGSMDFRKKLTFFIL